MHWYTTMYCNTTIVSGLQHMLTQFGQQAWWKTILVLVKRKWKERCIKGRIIVEMQLFVMQACCMQCYKRCSSKTAVALSNSQMPFFCQKGNRATTLP